jgi:hypothetical protein
MMRRCLFPVLLALAAALPAALPEKPMVHTLLGFPLTAPARAQLAEALAAHPACDLLYLPLLKARDGQAFKDYFLKAGRDPWVVLYLLRERVTFAEELTGARKDPLKLLERLLYANGLPFKEGLCPWEGAAHPLPVDGYSDEITDECYTLVLTYRFDGDPGQLSFDWCGPLEKDAALQEATRIFKQAGVPLMHRNIVQKRDASELKPPPKPQTPPPDAQPQ